MKIQNIVLFLIIVPLVGVSAITPDEYWDKIQHYFINSDVSIIENTIEIYSSGENIPLAVDSKLFMFFNGIKKHNPAQYNVFTAKVKISDNPRLMKIIEIIEDYDLASYLSNPKLVPAYIDNLLMLFYSSGDYQYMNMMYDFIQKSFTEVTDQEKFLAGRIGIVVIQHLFREFPVIEQTFVSNNSLDTGIKEYILNTASEDVKKDAMDFVALQQRNGIWK